MKTDCGTYFAHLKRIITKIIYSALCLLSLSLTINGQEISKRPSIGLVLSGGGSHGMAHIGVIKVMEEAGLRPDYITGVSMGSIIGGMYALGYSADSIHNILRTLDWPMILSNKIPQNKVIFLEKNNFYNSMLSLPLSSKKITLPSGIINGQLIENALSYYAWPAADISDFSKLPIPFMCVGADILSFKKIDLKTGYLPDAIRASFAVPSIFTPIKIDTMLLVDGGLLRNFAASEAKEMGADILIGSYAGFQAYKENELQSVSGIIKQIAFYRSLEDFNEEKKLVSTLIIHRLRNLRKTGFEDVDSLVRKGYEDALPYRETFRKLADSLNRIGPQKPLENILNKKTYSFDRIETEGNKLYSDSQILGVLDIDPGTKVDRNMLNDKIELLYGKAWFDKVRYRIEPRNDSLILVIHCEEKPQGMIYASAHFDNALGAGVVLGLSVKNLLTKSSMIMINSYIARFFRFELNAIQFINRNQKIGFAANFLADNTMMPMFDIIGEKGDVITRNFMPGATVSRYIGLNQLMSLSVQYENKNLIPQFHSINHIENISYNYLSAKWDYHVNSLNSTYFPKKGVILDLMAGLSRLYSSAVRTDSSGTVNSIYDSDRFRFDPFYTMQGHLKCYFSLSDKVTLGVGGDALYITTSDSISSGNNFCLLGGFEPVNSRSIAMTGFHANEIPVNRMAALNTSLDIELFRDIHLELRADAALVGAPAFNDGSAWLAGYGLGLGYMSKFGPVRAGLMRGSNSPEEEFHKIKGYISLGYKF
jgi:NTE family protein